MTKNVEEKCKDICLKYYTQEGLKKYGSDWNFKKVAPNVEYVWDLIKQKKENLAKKTYMWSVLLDKAQIALEPYQININPFPIFCSELNEQEYENRFSTFEKSPKGIQYEVKPTKTINLMQTFRKFKELEEVRKHSLEIFGIELRARYLEIYIKLSAEFQKAEMNNK